MNQMGVYSTVVKELMLYVDEEEAATVFSLIVPSSQVHAPRAVTKEFGCKNTPTV